MTQFGFLRPAPGKSDLARVKLLASALDVFGEKGPRGATVRAIAQGAGQNVASIAYYFGSKEKLYHAIIQGIVDELRERMADVFKEIEALRRRKEHASAEALHLILRFFREVYLRVLSRNEAVSIGRILIREQLTPSAGFDVLYEQGFRPLHEALCFLVGVVLGRNPRDRETMIRTHVLMGQVYFFMMTREAILRRLNWKDLEGEKAEWVADLIAEHAAVVLKSLSQTSARGENPQAPL